MRFSFICNIYYVKWLYYCHTYKFLIMFLKILLLNIILLTSLKMFMETTENKILSYSWVSLLHHFQFHLLENQIMKTLLLHFIMAGFFDCNRNTGYKG